MTTPPPARDLTLLDTAARQASMSRTRKHPAQASPKIDQHTTTARDNPGCLESEPQTKVSGITPVDLFDKDT